MRRYSKDQTINGLVKELVGKGWCFKQGRKHGKVIAPHGRVLTVPSTPSDWRAALNFKRDLRMVVHSV